MLRHPARVLPAAIRCRGCSGSARPSWTAPAAGVACAAGAVAVAAWTGVLPWFVRQEKEVKDDMELRLQQELQRTSFTEWKASGFDPEAAAKDAAKPK
mmetsp:Transcript_43421/g.80914  ORF Transcript_43421/g.80914 Transcript_43421/m.80914 type:complete len:98 (-) Transcript_43421:39-332(-)